MIGSDSNQKDVVVMSITVTVFDYLEVLGLALSQKSRTIGAPVVVTQVRLVSHPFCEARIACKNLTDHFAFLRKSPSWLISRVCRKASPWEDSFIEDIVVVTE
jgi:hypothetical protein